MKAVRAARRARPAGQQVNVEDAVCPSMPLSQLLRTARPVRVTVRTAGNKDSVCRNLYIRAAQIVLACTGLKMMSQPVLSQSGQVSQFSSLLLTKFLGQHIIFFT